VTLAIILLVLALGLSAIGSHGFQMNHIDLAPNYAGTLIAIINCLGNLMTLSGPLITAAIVTHEVNSISSPSHFEL